MIKYELDSPPIPNHNLNQGIRMSDEYIYTTLAIIDYKIDELSNKKQDIDRRLAHLYDLKQNTLEKLQEAQQHVCCNQKGDVF